MAQQRPGGVVLGNWQLSGVLTLMTGTPFSITAPAAAA